MHFQTIKKSIFARVYLLNQKKKKMCVKDFKSFKVFWQNCQNVKGKSKLILVLSFSVMFVRIDRQMLIIFSDGRCKLASANFPWFSIKPLCFANHIYENPNHTLCNVILIASEILTKIEAWFFYRVKNSKLEFGFPDEGKKQLFSVFCIHNVIKP